MRELKRAARKNLIQAEQSWRRAWGSRTIGGRLVGPAPLTLNRVLLVPARRESTPDPFKIGIDLKVNELVHWQDKVPSVKALKASGAAVQVPKAPVQVPEALGAIL